MRKILSFSLVLTLMFLLTACQKQSNSQEQSKQISTINTQDKAKDNKEYLKNVNALFGNMLTDYKTEVNSFKEGGATNWTIQPEKAQERLKQLSDLSVKINNLETNNNEKCLEVQKLSLDIVQSMINTVNSRLVFSTEKDKNKVNDAFNKEIGQIKKNTEKVQKLIDYKME